MPSQQIITQSFSDWRGGPWHSLGPDKGPQFGRRYDCVNMQVYENGTLGTRPCLTNIASTSNLNDTIVKGSAFFSGNYYKQLDAYSEKYYFSFSTANSVSSKIRLETDTEGQQTITGTTTYTVQGLPPRYSTNRQTAIMTSPYITIGDYDGVFGAEGIINDFNNSSPTTTTITHPASFDPHTIVAHRDRYWSYGDSTNRNRIHYSAPGDVTDWTTADLTGSFDVGADSSMPIRGVWPLYDSLVIAMADLTWFVYRFTADPAFGEIRYVGKKRIPDFAVQVAQPGDSLVFLTENGGIMRVTPEELDDESLSYIKVRNGYALTNDHYFLRGIVAQDRNAICLPYISNGVSGVEKDVDVGDCSFDYVNGVWVRSTYWRGYNTHTLIDAFQAGISHFGFLAYDTNTNAELYVREATLNRPSNDSDPYSDAQELAEHELGNTTTDQFDAEVYLARFAPVNDDGSPSSATIERIIIDFDYWNATGFETPAFTLRAEYSPEGGDEIEGATLGVLDATGLLTSGTYDSRRHRFVCHPAPLPPCSTIQVWISGVKSVAFVNIDVEYRVEHPEPGQSIADTAV